jgi:hypothetical protein
MNRSEILHYVHTRQFHIEKNKTGDVFCSKCLQASLYPTSTCCGAPTLTREEALDVCAKLREKWRVN